MAEEFLMPKLGLTMTEGIVREWLVADGMPVEPGEAVLVIETDKVETVVEARGSGVLRHTGVVGSTYACGDVIGYLFAPGLADAAPTPAPEPPPTSEPEPVDQLELEVFAGDEYHYEPIETSVGGFDASDDSVMFEPADTPAVQAVDPHPAPEPEFEPVIEREPEPVAAVGRAAPLVAEPVATLGVGERVLASPRARRSAADAGLDLLTVVGTGPNGRIVHDDVVAAIEHQSRVEAERVEAARLEAERVEAARLEAERVEAARLEAERVEAARLEAERVEAARLEAERVEAARLEAERVEAARLEAERVEAARLEAERQEAARLEAERVEAERQEAVRLEAERQEAARLEAERQEAARLEAERQEAARLEAERQEVARVEAARLEAQRLEAERAAERLLAAPRVDVEQFTPPPVAPIPVAPSPVAPIPAPADSPTEVPAASATAATGGARLLAEFLGIDLADIPSPPSGRVSREDVGAWVRARLAVADEAGARPADARPSGAAPDQRSIPASPASPAMPLLQAPAEIIPFEGMRGLIAERMQDSLASMAQLTLSVDVDVSGINAERERRRNAGHAIPGYTAWVVAAAAQAIEAHGYVNSQVTDQGLAILPDVHVGVAVALDDGLVVPVIEHANLRTVEETHTVVADLAGRARNGKLEFRELEGSTFSVTALGMYGVDMFTPVINPPNTAILGVGRLRSETGWDAGRPVERTVMTLSLTWDHRAFDGAPAAEFAQTIVRLLEAPTELV